MITFDFIPEYGIPESFLSHSREDKCCIFLISCHSHGGSQQTGTAPEDFTGYTLEDFQKGGMSFWFSLIHPEDVTSVSRKIIDAHEILTRRNPNGQEAIPLILRYRLRHRRGDYIRVKDSRYLLSYSAEGVIDNILCRIELNEKQSSGELIMEDLLRKEKSCNKMLDLAVMHQVSQRKELVEGAIIYVHDEKATFPRLTGREKEILHLIADGLSSKMIADHCCISINTVETHRRHLLEKLGVRNSMELVKKASKIFVL